MQKNRIHLNIVAGLVLFLTFFLVSSFTATAIELLGDDFTGTTIDTAKWVESDTGGTGGTVGNIQQNGNLSLTGSSVWAANMLKTVDTYTRTSDVTFSADITIPNCATYAMAMSYGAHITSAASYFAYYYQGQMFFKSFSPAQTATISPTWTCTNNVPFNMKLVVLSAGGAELYIDDVLKGTLTAGTFTGTFAIQGFVNTTSADNVSISNSGVLTVPGAPTSLSATAGDTEVSLSWTAPASDGGAPITDYIVEYKLTSEPTTWTTFSDGTSTTAAATVTGLTNGSSYDFRVSAVNSEGTGDPSDTDTVTPTELASALLTGLQSHWDLDEASGNRADSHGSNTLIPSGTGPSATGILSNGFAPTGAVGGGNLSVADNATISMGDYDFTLSTWVKVDSGTTGGIMIKWGSGGNEYGFYLYAGKFRFIVNGAGGYDVAESVSAVSTGTWYHLVGWYDSTAHTINLKVNDGTTVTTAHVGGAIDGTTDLTFGNFNNGSYLDGVIDSSSLWKRLLTTDEITSLYNAGTGLDYPFAAVAAEVPDVPTGLSSSIGASQVLLTWTAPASDGGAAITDYIVEYKLTSEPTTWTTFSDGTSTTAAATVTGLTNGSSYDFRVSAVNSEGAGGVSDTDTATPNISTPTVPQNLDSSISASQVLLTWTAPASDGGAAITDYIVEYKLTSEPTTWTTFADGTSTTTSATVTGLVDGSSYDFRVSAVNSEGAGGVSDTDTATPMSYLLYDDFTGTTIDTDKWSETDAVSTGGASGNVQQNGTLSLIGNSTWGANMLQTVDTFDRTNGNLIADAYLTVPNCAGTSAVALVYGGPTISQDSYFAYYYNGKINFTGFGNGAASTVTDFVCTNNVPFKVTMKVLQAGGAELYVDDVLEGTISAGTFSNAKFSLQGFGTNASIVDNFAITSLGSPSNPSGVEATAGDSQVQLTWIVPETNGSAITDYRIDYKISSDSSWTTFSDGTSTTASAIVTGLTNGVTYNFRVYASSEAGTSGASTAVNSTPISETASAPTAVSLSIAGYSSVAETLTGSYVYADPNADSEGATTFRWLNSDTENGTYSAIPGATSRTYVIQESDLNKYIKFEVTPIASVVPTNGSANLSSALGPVDNSTFLNLIISTGQSLSVGTNATPVKSSTQPFSNLMLSGTGGGRGTGTTFTPLIETTVETMGSSMANGITYLADGQDYPIVVASHGIGGTAYSGLKRGTTRYNIGVDQWDKIDAAATLENKRVRAIGITTIHGETDNRDNTSYETYKNDLVEWQQNIEEDISAVTGQNNTIPLFTDQMSTFTSTYINDATPTVTLAQSDAAEENPGKIYMVTPKYFFSYSDLHHLTGNSSRWLGEYYAKVMKKVLIDGDEWRPLTPDLATLSGDVVFVDFHVPAGELVFDTEAQTLKANYGFEYYDSTSSATISSVEIFDEDTVKVTLSNSPTGSNKRIRYAYTGTVGSPGGSDGAARGNLRDTDDAPSQYGNTLYNWAIHFDEPITLDSTAPTITNISSDKTNGTYTTGEVIDIDVTFSEAVTSTGNVTVTLETGGVDRECTFIVTNSATGTCNYTVQAGDVSSDLTVSSISGTIADQSSNLMTSFAPSTNLAANKALVVDTEDSTISSILATPTNVTSSITWTTDEVGSSIVDYGLTTSYGITTVETNTSPRVNSHSVELTSLIACSTYHYRVHSRDSALNTTTSSNRTFTTRGCAGGGTAEDESASSITTASGGRVNLLNSGKGIALTIPSAFSGSNAEFQVKRLDKTTTLASIGVPAGKSASGSYIYDFKALSDESTSITTFDNPITLTLTYDDSDVSGMDESSLGIYTWNGSAWLALDDCVVDTVANTVTCTTTHFSTFGLFGDSIESTTVTISSSGTTLAGRISNLIHSGNISLALELLREYIVIFFGHQITSTSQNEPLNQVEMSFHRDLELGMEGDDVRLLQQLLNSKGYIISETGVGSKGNETVYFGKLTELALSKYQTANGINPAIGYFGPVTREFISSH